MSLPTLLLLAALLAFACGFDPVWKLIVSRQMARASTRDSPPPADAS